MAIKRCEMKIYQLHQVGGEFEDYYDFIIGSYLRKERAEEVKAEVEEKEKKLMVNAKKCNNCPFLKRNNIAEVEDMLPYYDDYCSEIKLEDSPWGIDCDNYYFKYDESDYEIIEVEVEE